MTTPHVLNSFNPHTTTGHPQIRCGSATRSTVNVLTLANESQWLRPAKVFDRPCAPAYRYLALVRDPIFAMFQPSLCVDQTSQRGANVRQDSLGKTGQSSPGCNSGENPRHLADNLIASEGGNELAVYFHWHFFLHLREFPALSVVLDMTPGGLDGATGVLMATTQHTLTQNGTSSPTRSWLRVLVGSPSRA